MNCRLDFRLGFACSIQTTFANRVCELEEALERVKRLKGIIPVFGYCKRIREDGDYWQNLETYISKYSAAEFSHINCPTCYEMEVKHQLEDFAWRLATTGPNNRRDHFG